MKNAIYTHHDCFHTDFSLHEPAEKIIIHREKTSNIANINMKTVDQIETVQRGSLAARDSQSPEMKEQQLPMSVKHFTSGNKRQQTTDQVGEKP